MKDGVNRRSFMSAAAIPGAGLSFAPSLFVSQAKPAEVELNIALIGLGAQGNRLFDSCSSISGINIQAVCDIWQYNLDKAAHKLCLYNWFSNNYRIPNSYKDYRQMLEKEKNLDAVIIATPDFCHEKQTIDCLKAGLHVYCEKPMATTLQGARRMIQAQNKTGKLLQIGYQRRSNPKYIYCKNTLIDREKLIGRITAVNAQWNQSIRPDMVAPKGTQLAPAILKQYGYHDMRSFMNWRLYKHLSAGPAANLASQQIDVFNWFLSANPTAVTASGGTDYYDKGKHQAHDTVMAILEYETKQGKVRANQQTLKTNGEYEHFETFMGDNGTINLSDPDKGGIYPEKHRDYYVRKKWSKYVVEDKSLVKPPMDILDDNVKYHRIPVRDTYKEQEMFKRWRIELGATKAPPRFQTPIIFDEQPHTPHLQNFFETICTQAELNCPADIAFAAEVAVHKINEAIEARKTLIFDPKEFLV